MSADRYGLHPGIWQTWLNKKLKKCKGISIIWIKHLNMWYLRRNQRGYLWMRAHRCSLADDCRHTVCGTCQHASTWMWRSSGESSWRLHYGTGLCFPGMVHGHRTPERWKADASTVPSRLNVFSRGKGRKCFYAFPMNGAWLTVFSPYAAVVGPRHN